jgi:hypothetical protein
MSKHWTQTREGRKRLSRITSARWEAKRQAKLVVEQPEVHNAVETDNRTPYRRTKSEDFLDACWHSLQRDDKASALAFLIHRATQD